MAAQSAEPIERWTANPRVALVVSILLKGETSVGKVEDWRIPYLKAAFIECSYPNSMEELARTSKHLTPTVLARPHSR